MTEIETAVGSPRLKLTCSRDELVEQLAVVARAVSTRARGADPRRDPAAGRATAGSTLAATDMELSLRASLDAEVEGEGAVVVPGPPARRHRAAAAATTARWRSRTGAESTRARSSAAPASYRLHTHSAPRTSRGCPRSTPRRRFTVDRDALLETIARVAPLGVARRVAPGADRHPRPLRGRPARDGRDRLLPAVGEGDAIEGDGARARGDRPGAGADGARRASRTATASCRARRPREPRRLRRRRRLADDAAGSTASSRTTSSSCPRRSSTR